MSMGGRTTSNRSRVKSTYLHKIKTKPRAVIFSKQNGYQTIFEKKEWWWKKGSQKKKDEGENEDAEIENVSSKQSHASQSQAEESEQSASTGPAEPPPSKKHKEKKQGLGVQRRMESRQTLVEIWQQQGFDVLRDLLWSKHSNKTGQTKRECLRERLFKYEARSCRRPRKGLACNFFICLVKKKFVCHFVC